MKILFIGLNFHTERTQSSNFFIEFLKTLGTVTVRGEALQIKQPAADMADISDAEEFDLIVCWQVIFPAMALCRQGFGKKILWVPMADSQPTTLDLTDLKDVRTLCFSSLLFYQLQKLGFKKNTTIYAKYYPRSNIQSLSFDEIYPMFWNRQSLPSWKSVCVNLAKTNYKEFNVHWQPDDLKSGLPFSPPNQLEQQRFKIRLTTWFESKFEAIENLARSNLFFAPRMMEGIGMSFLDALAISMPVVGMDATTMNEYITHGHTGFLMDTNECKGALNGITPELLRKMSTNVCELVKFGYENWITNDLQRIKNLCII